jgi:uncharacterized protein DUF3237
MRLEHLYRLRFTYLEHWLVEGPDTQFFGIAEGRCEGAITGRFRGANSPRQRPDNVYLPDFDAIVETEDGATIAVHIAGFGRAREDGAREVVGSVTHLSGDERYTRLNDALCVLTGESRDKELVIDVAELVWEPLAD